MSAESGRYDGIGHVVVGLLILGACEAAHDGRWLIDRDWPPSRVSLYMTMAYSIGQVVATLSRLFIERLFLGLWLKSPADVLLSCGRAHSGDWRRRLFPGYCRPLDDVERARVLHAARRDGVADSGHSLLEYAHGSLERNATARKKAENILHEAWLWRNLCMGLLIVAAILTFGMAWHSATSSWGKSDWRKFGYCSAALLESTILLYRYLKSRRQHAVEILAWYADISPLVLAADPAPRASSFNRRTTASLNSSKAVTSPVLRGGGFPAATIGAEAGK